MTRHYPDLGSVSDWLKQISKKARPIRSTTHIWEVTRHQYGILCSFLRRYLAGKPGGKTDGGVAKCAFPIFGACAVTCSEITSSRLRSLIGRLSFLAVPNMALAKINIQEHRTKSFKFHEFLTIQSTLALRTPR